MTDSCAFRIFGQSKTCARTAPVCHVHPCFPGSVVSLRKVNLVPRNIIRPCFTKMADGASFPSPNCPWLATVTAVRWVHTLPLPLYFSLLNTSQRRDDIWQNRNMTDRGVTGEATRAVISSRCPNYSVSRLCEGFRVCLKVCCKW